MTGGPRASGRTALVWSAVEVFGQQGINLLVHILLARQVAPAEFGLVAMLMIFLAISLCLSDSGFPYALVQKTDADQIDKSSVFFLNILIGLGLAGLLYAASGSIAAFYEQPKLERLTHLMGLMVVCQSFGMTHDALSRKMLDFRRRTIATVTSSVGAGVVAVIMAFQGMGVWALATHMILMRLLQSLLLWWAFPWRPSWVFSISRLQSMFGFGSRVMMAGMLSAIFDNIYLLAIGKLYTPTLTGYYSFAKRLQMFPAQNLNRIFSQVAFPLLADRQSDLSLVRDSLRKFIKTSALAIMPLMSILAGLAVPLIHAILGSQWIPAVPYFQLLCGLGMLLPLHGLNLQVLLATGNGKLFLRVTILKKAMTVINLVAMASVSMIWLIRGELIVSVLGLMLNCFITGRLFGYGIWQQFRDLVRTFLFATLQFAICILWVRWSPWGPWPTLLIGGFVSVALSASYVGVFERWAIQAIGEIVLSKTRRSKPVAEAEASNVAE